MAVPVALPLTRPSGRAVVPWAPRGEHTSSVLVTRRHPPEGPDRGGAPEAPGRAPEGSRARLADLGIVAYAAVFPLLQVAVICESPGLGYGPGAWAAGGGGPRPAPRPPPPRPGAPAGRAPRPPPGGLSLLVVAAAVVAVTPWA